MKEEFKYSLTPSKDDTQEEEFEKALEKEIESQCDFGIYVNELKLPDDFTDEELMQKSKEEIIEYKNSQIIKLKAYIASLRQEKEDLINNYKNTTDQLLDNLKDSEFRARGFRPETPLITKNMMMKRTGVQKSDFGFDNTKITPAKKAVSSKRMRCPNCTKDFPESEFIAHSLQCLRKNIHCKICGELVEEGKKSEHLQKYRNNKFIVQTIKEGDLKSFKNVIDHGFEISTVINEDNGDLPIHLICKMNKTALLEVLLSKNECNINEVNKNKDTALLISIANKNFSCAKMLIEKGADIKVRNKGDMSPLMLSCKVGDIALVKILINKGANINEKNILGDTPLKIAQMNKHEELVMMLLKDFNADIRYGK